MSVPFGTLTCSRLRCQNPPRSTSQRYCQGCHNAWMRANRPTYGELTPEQRRRSNCRSRTRDYVRRGHLTRPTACPRCKKKRAAIEAHHQDYDRPLEVEWLCRSCHRTRHKAATSLAEKSCERS